MTAKISIIVPVYKVEKYLDKCVKSILAQSYKNIEVILVDDGSPDRCGKICDEFAKNDSRIKVIHKENGGLSSARNSGVTIATGEYVGFVDSDDYIESNMYEELLKVITVNDADIALCGYDYVDEKGNILTDFDCDIKNEICTKEQILEKTFGNKGFYYVTACNRLYSISIAKKIRFPEGKLHEDEFAAHRFYGECDKIACCRDKLYHYVQREGSIMNSDFSAKRLDGVEAFIDRHLYLKSKGYKALANKILIYAYAKSLYYIENIDLKKYRNEIIGLIKQITPKLAKVSLLRVLKLWIVYFKKICFK